MENNIQRLKLNLFLNGCCCMSCGQKVFNLNNYESGNSYQNAMNPCPHTLFIVAGDTEKYLYLSDALEAVTGAHKERLLADGFHNLTDKLKGLAADGFMVDLRTVDGVGVYIGFGNFQA